MKSLVQTSYSNPSGYFAKFKHYKISAIILSLACLPMVGFGDTTWTGAVSQNWNNAANWNNGLPGAGNGATFVNTATGNYPILTNDAPTGQDIRIGASANGRLDQTNGVLSTGNGNWFFLGYSAHQATYNLADTTTTGGTFTGFGQGSGSLYVGGVATPTGNLLLGLDGGTLPTMNINTTGTVAAGYLCVGGTGANNATLNLDNGTVNISGNAQIGGDQYGQNAGNNQLNMSGGVFTANGITLSRGDNNASVMKGAAKITGGTLNSKTWFTLGFAGSATAFAGVTNSGGTINVNISGTGNMEMTVYDPMSAYFEQNSGALNLCNNAYISFGNGGNNSGVVTFTQNGGTVTFYSDTNTTVGGTGYLKLGTGADTGTYAYNLVGGILTVPNIQRSASGGSGTFNFNGGTLKPTASTTTFMQGLSAANVQAGGAIIDTTNFNITIAQNLQDGGGGGLTKLGTGTLKLSGGYGYTGFNKVLGGGLSLSTILGAPSSGGDLIVSNAALSVTTTGGTAVPAGNINLPGTNVLSFAPSVTPNTAATCINASGTLSNTGTNVVNISGTGLSMGVYHLITVGSGSVTTNNFVLGTLPAGISGVLTNSTSTSLDLLVTAAGQLLSWVGYDGSGYTTAWDVGTTIDWYDMNNALVAYQQYSGNTIGDSVVFGKDGIQTTDTNYVNLTANVVPTAVTFNWNYPYVLSGAGSIGGITSLVVTDTPSVMLLTSNSYTGGTFIYGGTLAITNDNALGATANAVTLGGGRLQLNDAVTSSRALMITANSTVGVATNKTAQLSGAVSGTGGLTKAGVGTLSLTGSNSLSGAFVVAQGTVATSGTNQMTGLTTVGNTSGAAGVLTVSGGEFDAAYNPGNVYDSSLQVGTASGAAGTVRLNSGTLTIPKQLALGSGSGGSGSYQQANGNASVGGFLTVGLNSDQAAFSQSGGTFIHNGPATIGAGAFGVSNAVGVASFSGSAVFTNGYYDSYFKFWVGENGTGIMNISGSAAVTISADNFILGRNAGANGVLNLNGGTLSVMAVEPGAGTGTVNFNGGTLKAVMASSSFLTGLASATVYSGGAVINDGGFAVTVNQPLLAPAGYGVSSIDVSAGGSGYIAPPVVTLSGGSGSNATAVATISGGVVTGFTITSPGTGYASGDSLTASLSGGGATLAASAGTVTLMPNVGGGLTKNGTGTLTLGGADSYTGNTVVNAGKLFVTPAHQATNGVSVADGATYGVILPGAPATVTNGAVTLAAGSTTLRFVMGTNGNTIAPLLVTGPLTNNGTLNVALAGSSTKFAVGTFPLVTYGAGSVIGTFNPAITGPNAMSITLSNDSASSTLYAVVNDLGSGIVWAGTNSAAATTNVWDVNTTLNWLALGNPAVYQETTPPGDAVTFNDSGTGLVLLSNTVNPLNLIISNNAVAYAFNGSGHVSGTMNLTKLGTGTATMNYVGNNYTGSTVVSNGTLKISGGQAIGDASAVVLADVAAASLVVTNGETIGSLAGGGSTGGNVVINGGTLTTGGNGNSTTFAGSLSGTGGLVHVGPGTLVLSRANNTYSGDTGIGISAGPAVLRVTATQALGTGTVGLDLAGNASTARLELTGGISLANAITFPARNNNSVGIESISGNNTLSGSITLGAGGSTYQIQSDAGTLTLGTSITTAITAASGSRTVTLQGAGSGNIAGAILDGGGTVGILKNGPGTWTLSGFNIYNGATTVSNGTLLVNGSMSGAVTVSGGTLGGTGIVGGAVTVNSGGTLSPGASPGTMTINGNITLNGGSTNVFEVNAGGSHDLVAAGAGVAYGGVLNVVPTGTFSAGQQFQLFSGAGATNASNFASIQGSPGSGLGFNFTNGVLSVASISGGSSTLTNMVSGGGTTLQLSWGNGWELERQTNSLGAGLGTNWQTYVAGNSGIYSTNVSIDKTNGAVFFRLKQYP